MKFSSLLAIIQGAAEHAAQAVAQENLKILKSYFHTAPGKSADSDDAVSGPLAPADFEQLTPRAVEMKFPNMTHEGPQEQGVLVPLISLTPVSGMQMSELEIDMDIEVLENNGELEVGFPHLKRSILGEGKMVKPKPNAKLKIKISPDPSKNGLASVIEGYDKALRAQLPN